MNPWVPALGWLLLLLWLTLTPRPLPGDLEQVGRVDLAGHFLLFAVLAALVARAAGLTSIPASAADAAEPDAGKRQLRARRANSARAPIRTWAMGAVLAGVAAVDELLQPPLADRDAAWSDLLANLAGIGLGLAVALWIGARRRAAAAVFPTPQAPSGTAAGSRESGRRSRRRR